MSVGKTFSKRGDELTYGIDEDWNFGDNTGDKAVERLHPVTLEQEVAVDVKVAAVVARSLGTKRFHDFLLVQVFTDPLKVLVAQIASLALLADIIHILSGALVGAHHGVVAVNRSRHAGPNGLAVVAILDEGSAARVGILHRLTVAGIQDSGPSTFAASHGLVVLVLCQAVGETVANCDGLEIDVAFLVAEDLGSEDGDVVPCVRFAGDVEGLFPVLGELLEEQSEERVDVFGCCDCVADGASTVRVADVDGLVEEDDAGVGVPRRWVVLHFNVLCDAGRAQFHEQTGQARATRSSLFEICHQSTWPFNL